MPSGSLVRVRDGDVITIRFHNPSNEPIDVSVIYIDATYGISTEFPKAGDDNRVEPDAVFDGAVRFANQKGIEISDSTVGLEHILVLAEPASKASKKDYRYLAQGGIGPAPSVRAAGGSDLGEFLNEALWPWDTGGGARRSRAAGVGDGVARMLSFEVVKSMAADRTIPKMLGSTGR